MDQNDYELKTAESGADTPRPCSLCVFNGIDCVDAINEGSEWIRGCAENDAPRWFVKKPASAENYTLKQAPHHVNPCGLCAFVDDFGSCGNMESWTNECVGGDSSGYWERTA